MARDKRSTKRRKGARDGPAKHFIFHVEVNISRAKRLSGGMLINSHTLCTETLAWILGRRSSNRQQWAKWHHNRPLMSFSIFVLCSGRREAFGRRSRGQIDHSVYTNTESEVGKEASE